jgi:pyruvate dehydrogenase E1 component
MEMVLDTFHNINDERPTAIVAYTIKGFGLPLAGHKDNHSGLLSPRDIEQLRESLGISAGDEWEPFAGIDMPQREVAEFIRSVPFIQQPVRRYHAPVVSLHPEVKVPIGEKISTQAAFGRLLNEYARLDDPVVDHILTMAPDVASSTNLGPWITKRGIFDRRDRPNLFADEKIRSTMPWSVGPNGQHIELGIAETNLFVLLSAAGLAAENHGVRLFPIGTVYDPFICRGLDALNYACYQNARFMLVGTPSGVTLSPEGGAHQSIYTPLIGVGQPGLTYFEPAYADELCEIVKWSFDHLQAEDGGSVYLRLSTRALEQPQREMTGELRTSILNGGYWLVPPSGDATHVVVAMGAVLPEAVAAHRELLNRGCATGLLVVTSPDVLCQQWCQRIGTKRQLQSNQMDTANLMSCVDPSATLVTVLDGHPLSLAWLGATAGFRVRPLGVSSFGMSGYVSELHREHGIDSATIVQAVLGDLEHRAEAK